VTRFSPTELAAMIDHSIIDPNHTDADMRAGIDLAIARRTGRFTTHPYRVAEAKRLLDGTGIQLQTYVGYPHGNDKPEVKKLQAKLALEDGVDELDMVINISALLDGDIAYVEREVASIVALAAGYGVTVKAIIEVYFLNEDQIVAAALAAERAGVAFVKTSTGTRPDQQDDVTHAVELLRSVLKPSTVIKASGGVYNLDAVLAYYEAGARRFGASESAAILDDLAARNAAEQGSLSV
jgi:deoxyribose-phosphate aldolase